MRSFGIFVFSLIMCVLSSCSEPAISEQTMHQVDSLVNIEGRWTPEQVGFAKDLLIQCYTEVTPRLVDIADDSKNEKEYLEKSEKIEKELEPVQKLYEKFMESSYYQVQYDAVMNAREKMLDKVDEALN